MKHIGYICVLFILLSACKNTHTRSFNGQFETIESVRPRKIFDIPAEYAAESVLLIHNNIVLENKKTAPLYSFYNDRYQPVGSFGEIENGHGEFGLPHLIEGAEDSMEVIDNGKKEFLRFTI